jgi:hypothetical protein
VLKPTDQVFDLARARLCVEHLEGNCVAECALRACEPAPRRRRIALEEFERKAKTAARRSTLSDSSGLRRRAARRRLSVLDGMRT